MQEGRWNDVPDSRDASAAHPPAPGGCWFYESAEGGFAIMGWSRWDEARVREYLSHAYYGAHADEADEGDRAFVESSPVYCSTEDGGNDGAAMALATLRLAVLTAAPAEIRETARGFLDLAWELAV